MILLTVYSSRMPFYEFLRERVFLRDENGIYPLWCVISILSGTTTVNYIKGY
jgi:hypothetical protein